MSRPRQPGSLTRRQLLQLGGATAAGALLGCPPSDVISADATASPRDGRFFPDRVHDSAVPDHGADDPGTDADRGALEDAGPDDRPSPPLLFLHLSDIHVGVDDIAVPAFTYCLETVLPALCPTATFVTGDLVNRGSEDEQWATYRGIVDRTGVEAERFIEVPGNHDAMGDLLLGRFLQHSLTGRAGRGTYGVRVLEAHGRRLRVVAINTASGDGETRNLPGYLAETQVDALIADIDSADAEVEATLLLGHHPATGVDGLPLYNTDVHFDRLVERTGAALYLHGHRHRFKLFWEEALLMTRADTVGNPSLFSGQPGFSLVTWDDGPRVRNVPLVEEGTRVRAAWPQVVITRPADADFAEGNPRSAPLPRAGREQRVRAVAVSAEASIEQVRLRIDGGVWQPMAAVDHFYEARVDLPDTQASEIEVEAEAGGALAQDRVRVLLS